MDRKPSHYSKWGKMEQLLLAEKKTRFQVKRASVKKTGKPFELEFTDVEWPEQCPVLHIPLNYQNDGDRNDHSPSWSLLIREKGWVKGNVKIVSWRASRLRGDGTWKEHKLLSEYFMGDA